ncbi:Phage-like protein [Sodalis praecaptivus]|uniref:Phage-like protein n=1 Tax=Sodalis praecaptivus TaxID=1239307 RepID=W0I081_9GAMM|nr:hypothetical protein [Sodalis praecaptivus]AHF77885.1 Phage-like protein [Sodalis praecaptivus]
MANYGMEIWRQDGSFFASPQYTPMVLVKVIDLTVTAQTGGITQSYATGIPSSQRAILFIKATSDNKVGALTSLEINNSEWVANVILDNSTPSGTYGFRLYVFGNYVPNPSGWGIAFYDASGKCIYTGTSLPLQIKRVDNINGLSGFSAAAYSGFSYAVNQPTSPGDPNIGVTIFYNWMGASDGIAPVVYFVAQYNGGAPDLPVSMTKSLYIETQFYDDNYQFSLQ